ncbi:MAG: hypothetical protein K0B11_13400 [Mariniphaga sp.]|nr:hypothetical protein [Mariniphaga sp.]
MSKTPDILIFQQEFPNIPGKPERKPGFLPAKMYGFKCRQNLNISNMRMDGEFGKCEQIRKLNETASGGNPVVPFSVSLYTLKI